MMRLLILVYSVYVNVYQIFFYLSPHTTTSPSADLSHLTTFSCNQFVRSN